MIHVKLDIQGRCLPADGPAARFITAFVARLEALPAFEAACLGTGRPEDAPEADTTLLPCRAQACEAWDVTTGTVRGAATLDGTPWDPLREEDGDPAQREHLIEERVEQQARRWTPCLRPPPDLWAVALDELCAQPVLALDLG